jgi:lycopene cyclase CruA
MKRDGGGARVPDLQHFRSRYPLTVASLGALPDREVWLRAVWEAEARWRASLDDGGAAEVVVRGAPPARLSVEGEFEIIYAGASLGLLHAATLARRYGRRALVLAARDSDAVAAQGARLWNVSSEDLEGLARAGLFTKEEIESFVTSRRRAGLVKFHDAGSRVKSPPLEVRGVLDVTIDAERLLASASQKLSARVGCAVVECARVVRVYVEAHRVSVEVEDARGARRRLFAARLFVDARGADSGVARQLRGGRAPTHVRPSVGTVARGLARGEGADRVDFGAGEIVVTTEDASAHRQLLWGGFACDARLDEFATRLFFHDAVDSHADKSLLALFERYFEKLPTYKRAGAQFRVVRPLFSYGASYQDRSWKSRASEASADRVLLASDGADRASPLAPTGASASLRELDSRTRLTELALAADLLDARALSEIAAASPRAASTTHLAEFLRPPARSSIEPATVNETLNAVTLALHDLDEGVRRELFQDRLSFGALKSLLSRTVRLYPRILQRVAAHLGARGTFLWLAHAAEAAFKERRGEPALRDSPASDESRDDAT